jgi:phosphatidylinositol alpha-1,6-mannosyltransferase
MRLLYVSHSFPPPGRPLKNVGGMQRVATELHAALRARSDVTLDDVLLRTSWRWTHLKTLPFLAKVYRQVKRRVEAGAADAVLFSSMVTASTAWPLRSTLSEAGVPMVAVAHGRDVTLPVWPYQRLLLPRVFGALDAVLPVSRATGQALRERGLPERKVRVVPNGVDTERFAPPRNRTAARRALTSAADASLPDDALLLCSVGRQVERKGFAWFVRRVMPRLPGNVHYWLAGDGPEADALRDAVDQHDLTGRVRLLGRVPEALLQKLYRGSDLFVMPNVPVQGDMEGFGVVMLEASLSGLPVVAARLEGIRDVIAEGENGHLVESGDAGAFADRIRQYRDDRAELREAAQRAARYTRRTFSWGAVTGEYVEALHALTAEEPAVPVPA